jgi:hypothetical protein
VGDDRNLRVRLAFCRECQGLLCIIGRTGDAVKLKTNCLMFGPLASRLPILHRKRDFVPLMERSLKTAKRGLNIS